MIFYFSGTGNSQWVARQIGRRFGETPLAVAEELHRTEDELVYALRDDERVFFVFPVHSWGPAVLMKRFVERLRLEHYREQEVYVVCTCGDNCGLTDRIMGRALARRGIRLTQAYSLQMPNNYVLMKGFGVDDKPTEEAKLAAAPAALEGIFDDIQHGQREHPHYVAGSGVWVKSRVVYPLFCSVLVGGRSQFYATEACIGCGLCVKVCPTGTVSLQEGRPVWGRECVQCTACIHRCPVRAIEYGNTTQGQGRYRHPEAER